MYLTQFLLPTFDNSGHRFPKEDFDHVRQELVDHFGGVTAFVRSPAVGVWTDEDGHIRRDEVAIFEVMADTLDRDWWAEYRRQLEHRFRQEEVVIRATHFDRM